MRQYETNMFITKVPSLEMLVATYAKFGMIVLKANGDEEILGWVPMPRDRSRYCGNDRQ